jgi:hypothetical protein
MIRLLFRGLAVLAVMLAAMFAVGGPAAAQSRLFSSDSSLQLTLTAPFPTLIHAAKTAKGNMKPYAATLAVRDGAGAPVSLPLEVRGRGISRRVGGFCAFPPLQLRFSDKDALKGTVFKGQKKLKLVTYCQDHDAYEQRIMLEYLVYRIYGVLTPMSYRVRPAEVTYRTDDKDKGVTRFGYLIEDADALADRNNVKLLTLGPHQITAQQFDQHAAARAALFEYMISNLDWDFLAAAAGQECCHNSRFVAASDAAPLKDVTPLIYDFDFSGFVDSPYASPPEGLPVHNVTERLYRGYCASSGEIPAVAAEFKAHRAEFMALIASQPRLDPKVAAKTTRFMDGFFAILDDPARVEASIIKHCR